MKILFLLFLILSIYSVNADYVIYMIRHGEKVNDETVGLSKKGINRSNKVKNIFVDKDIKYLYAQEYNKETKERIRPYLTLKPLSKKINVNIDITCKRDDIKCITNKILKSVKKGNVLISWQHDNLQKIAEKLIIKLKIKGNNLNDKIDDSNSGYNFLWKFKNNKLKINNNYIKELK